MKILFYLWSYAGYVVLIGMIVAGLNYLPKWSFARVPQDYRGDMSGPDFEPYNNLQYDGTIGIDQLLKGDIAVFRLGDDGSRRFLFARVAGLPGDILESKERTLLVNGSPSRGGLNHKFTKMPPTVVPKGHVFLLSDLHRYDSIDYGFFPESAIHGRLTQD